MRLPALASASPAATARTSHPGNNYVVNCEIYHAGQVFRTYHGAVSLSGVHNRIAHCYIHDVPHQGIGYGGNDHIIEYCDFTRIAQETGDVGVTYTGADWTFMGHEFRGNYFHNIHGPGGLGCFTIYPDLPCGGINLHHNVFYDVDQVFHTNSGRAMVVENNLFLRCRGLSFSTWTQDHMFKPGGSWHMVENLQAVKYDQPPYSTRYPALQHLAADFALGGRQSPAARDTQGQRRPAQHQLGDGFLPVGASHGQSGERALRGQRDRQRRGL